MARDTREPQSYGSGSDWVTGNTGQQVHDQKSTPPPEHREFYESRRDSENSPAPQGGLPSEAQFSDSESDACHAGGEETPVQKVTAEEGGAKRNSYFKKRDYE